MTISFEAWKEGNVASTTHEVSVIMAKPGPKLEAVSERLKRELIHPNRTSVLVGLRYSPDGQRLIAGDYPGGTVIVWDAETGRQIHQIETGYGYRGSSEYLFLSPDWQRLYVSKEKRKAERIEEAGKRLYRWTLLGDVRAWDLDTGELTRTYKHEPQRSYRGMLLSPDGRKIVTYDELPGVAEGRPQMRVTLWDLTTGNQRELPEGIEFVALFSPDSKTLATTTLGKDYYATGLKLYDAGTGREKLSIPIEEKHTSTLVSAISPDGSILVAASTHYKEPKKYEKWTAQLRWWDATTGRQLASIPGGENDSLYNARFSPDGKTLAVLNWQGPESKLLLFRVSGQRLLHTVILGKRPEGLRLVTNGPVFSPDGKTVAVASQVMPESKGAGDIALEDCSQPRVHLVDASAGVVRETLVCPLSFGRNMCFSPDGKTLATGGHGKVLLWDLSKPPGTTTSTGK